MFGHDRLTLGIAALTVCALVGVPSDSAGAEKVTLKNGIVYRGAVDRDKPMVWVFDGLKRIVLYDSKIATTEADSSFGTWEVFKLVQPLIQHAGTMPREAYDVELSPWNDRARRTFSYKSARSPKPIRMEQAIYELGPFMVRLRGVDGFWQDGRLSTSQVPREVVLGLLAKVDRTNQNERRRVASFLIQAEWYVEARRELEALIRDFPQEPGLRETMRNALAAVADLAARQLKAEIDTRQKALQPRWVDAKLKTFPSNDVPSDILIGIRDQMRHDEAQEAADKALADSLRSLAGRLASDARKTWNNALVEVLKALLEAPDAVRERFVAWQKTKDDTALTDDAHFALAMSGFVVGADAAVADLATASTYWEARNLLRDYLAKSETDARAAVLEKLESFSLPADPSKANPFWKHDLLTKLAIRMPPPLLDEDDRAETVKIHRVHDDENTVPTEYAAYLPPEYHPLRSYPVVVALHGGDGPKSAIAWWQAEAARRGYIVIAPEYLVAGEKEYGFSTSEHAAVELALRDARRRFAIDSDRVFLGGQLHGGDMAWDFGLAHPDLFAGVAIVSGQPLKYVFRYLPHVEKLPLYVAMGDLAPAGSEIVFSAVLKPLIAKAQDVTYVEYYRRGLEDLPEEAPAILDWMDRRRRESTPKTFDTLSARESDSRFYGIVVREFSEGRTTTPEAAEPFGKNLNPATIKLKSSVLSNNLMITINGIKRLDVWVSPRLIDFKKKMEVRVNRKTIFKGMAKPELEPFLEDLRLRGDRQQIYWLKVPVG